MSSCVLKMSPQRTHSPYSIGLSNQSNSHTHHATIDYSETLIGHGQRATGHGPRERARGKGANGGHMRLSEIIYCVARWRGIRERDIRCERNKQAGDFFRQTRGHTAWPADTCYPILDTREQQSMNKWGVCTAPWSIYFMVTSLVQARTTMTAATATATATNHN